MWFLLGARFVWKQTRLVAERLPKFSYSHSGGGDPLAPKDGCVNMPGKANRARSADVSLSEPPPPPPPTKSLGGGAASSIPDCVPGRDAGRDVGVGSPADTDADTHEEEDPSVCPLCQEKFSGYPGIRLHQRQSHPEVFHRMNEL